MMTHTKITSNWTDPQAREDVLDRFLAEGEAAEWDDAHEMGLGEAEATIGDE